MPRMFWVGLLLLLTGVAPACAAEPMASAQNAAGQRQPLPIEHYLGLLAGYGTAIIAGLLVGRLFPDFWPRPQSVSFPQPYREIAVALLAVAGVLVVGRFLPRWNRLGPLMEAVYHLVIFLPILVLPLVRGHELRTAWIKTDRIALRVLVGLALATLAITAYTVIRPASDGWPEVIPRVYQLKNFGNLVQVLCEDIAIAILFVRLRTAIGLRATIVLVAFLFAAAHIPTMVNNGVSQGELARLLLDAALGVLVLSVAQRSEDVWCLWCVHFAMDMMQFHTVTSIATP